MLESIEVADVIPASPKQIFDAWLDSAGHAAITGGRSPGNSVTISIRWLRREFLLKASACSSSPVMETG